MRLFLILLVIPFLTSGQHAVIKGVAPLSIGKEIQLRVNEDPISGKEKVLSRQTVDVDGSFELKVMPDDAVQYAFLQVGQNCADFFMERGKDLQLTFVPPKKDPRKPEAFYERHFFAPKILGGRSATTNLQILSFNDTLDTFLEALYPVLVNRKSSATVDKALDGFDQAAQAKFKTADPFVKSYIRFAIATVEQTFAGDRAKLFTNYLKNTRPQFNNPTYVDFLLQYYQGVVYKMAVVNNYEASKKAFEGTDAFAALQKMLLEQEPTLTDASVRGLVLIEGVHGLFGQREFVDAELIRALETFAATTSDPVLATAARNTADKHHKLATGTNAPEIAFVNTQGKEERLSDLQGSYVFLELTDATNGYCQRETNVVASLKQEFKEVRFLTVCIGNSKAEMLSLQKQMNITWELGQVEITSSIIDDYDIKSLPLFYIIDPDGKFYSVPAKDPTKGAQGELMSLTEKLKTQGRKGVGK